MSAADFARYRRSPLENGNELDAFPDFGFPADEETYIITIEGQLAPRQARD